MAMVLSSEDEGYFAPGLRRSHSQPRLGPSSSKLHASVSTSRLSDLLSHPSVSSSSLSSRSFSPKPQHGRSSFASDWTESATSSSSASDCDDSSASEDGQAPGSGGFYSHPGTQQPPSSPQCDHSEEDESASDQDDSSTISRPGSPAFLDKAEDDISVRPQPSRHVDYLSHDWREEDIWSSWKFIVSRRGDYSNAARLENASWRTWMKSKNNLPTIPAEALNWLKDCDVTWLYGPLQTGVSSVDQTSTTSTSARISKSNSFTKKPILKKRSMSEIMLQRSLSTSSLVKQAAAAVQAQQQGGRRRIGRRPNRDRDATDYMTFPFSSRESSSRYPSTRTSGITSPNSGRKHIHFNEQVSQCIAVDVRGDDDDEDDDDDDNDGADRYRYDSDSDDEGIVMKVPQLRKRRPTLRRKKKGRNGPGGESKTIAMLPSTTLKPDDSDESAESAVKHSISGGLRSPILSPSSSQETLRPTKKPSKIFFAGDESDEDDDDDVEKIDIRPGSFSAQPSAGSGGLRRTTSTASLSGGSNGGMRRTTSGIFRPVEEPAPAPVPAPSDDGLLSQILKTESSAAFGANRLRR
ncbi:hypothetical protein VTJ83DRAFT_2139 [Remersonia thermophila]|uniref:Nitrogen regulatory protein areA GATA-like domain-containing protein n=1 Tax=Remersonia thermophila TaxID=72144 RepID=A0ABR4DII7_9PEZI